MKSIFFVLFILFFIVVLNGCSGTRMPTNWPGFAASDSKMGCAAIDGRYDNEFKDRESLPYGVASRPFPGYQFSQVLERLINFWPIKKQQIAHPQYFEIESQGDNILRIYGRDVGSSQSIFELVFVKSQAEEASASHPDALYYKCENGFFEISKVFYLPISPVLFGTAQRIMVKMRKAVDGSLVVHAKEYKTPLLPLIPVPIPHHGNNFDDWFRFEPYGKSSPVSDKR